MNKRRAESSAHRVGPAVRAVAVDKRRPVAQARVPHLVHHIAQVVLSDWVQIPRVYLHRGAGRDRRVGGQRLKPAVERHDAGEFHAGTGHLQDNRAPEAVAVRPHTRAVDDGHVEEHGQADSRAAAKLGGVSAQQGGRVRAARAVAAVLAVHVDREPLRPIIASRLSW